MAVNYYNASNCVVDMGKVVYIESHKTKGLWVHEIIGTEIAEWFYFAWKHTRRCQCKYTYTGMDDETATSCKNAMIQQYTRSTKYSRWSTSDGRFNLETSAPTLMAKIQKIYNGCGQWNVVVDVDEYDEMWSLEFQNPTFPWCSSRTYYPKENK